MKVKKEDVFQVKIRKLRLEKGMTQGRFAKELGISRGCLANYETGVRYPEREIIMEMARILGVSLDFLNTSSKVKKVSLNEEELKVFTRANEKLKTYGDIINLNEVNVISRIQIIDFFNYLKEKEKIEAKLG